MNQEAPETLPISRVEFLQMEIFKNVKFESLAGYLLNCKVVEAQSGDKLIDPQAPDRKIIILLEGMLEAKSESKGGSYVSKISPGHCAGEMSVFDNIPPSALVTATEHSRLLVIPPDVALAMINASHELCLNFLHILSQRLRNNNQVVCEEQFHIQCIEQYAKVDPMTGLHNRRWLEEMYTRDLFRTFFPCHPREGGLHSRETSC